LAGAVDPDRLESSFGTEASDGTTVEEGRTVVIEAEYEGTVFGTA
jgi:hypothetical protein